MLGNRTATGKRCLQACPASFAAKALCYRLIAERRKGPINKNIQNQRLKITAFIKTSELRSDGIEVKVYIQNFKNNTWSETYTNSKLANKIEESILNEARNLRNNSSN